MIASVQVAIEGAEQLLEGPLLYDLTDPATGELTPIFLVTDNGIEALWRELPPTAPR